MRDLLQVTLSEQHQKDVEGPSLAIISMPSQQSCSLHQVQGLPARICWAILINPCPGTCRPGFAVIIQALIM